MLSEDQQRAPESCSSRDDVRTVPGDRRGLTTAVWAVLAGLSFLAADQVSKLLAESFLASGRDRVLGSVLTLRLVHNEGVAFGHKTHVRRLLKFRDVPDVIRLAGGAARSDVWLQIFTDVFGLPVQVPDGTELGALGAAIAAAVAAGCFADYDHAVARMVRFSRTVQPNGDRIDLYKAKYQRYNNVIEALDPVWRQLGRD